MDIKFDTIDGKTVFSINGRLDTSNYEKASDTINARIDAGEKKLIANLENMDYISSSGLRVFLSILKKLKANGGDIILCCIQPKIKEVFEISGFNTLFTITSNFEEAKEK